VVNFGPVLPHGWPISTTLRLEALGLPWPPHPPRSLMLDTELDNQEQVAAMSHTIPSYCSSPLWHDMCTKVSTWVGFPLSCSPQCMHLPFTSNAAKHFCSTHTLHQQQHNVAAIAQA
jgi:hypothetical protein